MKRLVGVCSWSMRPASPAELVQRVRACGLGAVQLALDPIRRGDWNEDDGAKALADAGIRIASGMMGMKGEDYSTLDSIRRTGGVRLDANWTDNLAAAKANAAIAQRLGIPLVTFHAGFLPHDPRDPERATMLDRLRQIGAAFAAHGVAVAYETGQETAETLEGVLRELGPAAGGAGVNFDPANMILYAMGDPVLSLRRLALAGWVRQVHIKDALPSPRPGEWGKEVPVGNGAVDWPAFFAELDRAGLRCDLMIEREAGVDRTDDIRRAAAMIAAESR